MVPGFYETAQHNVFKDFLKSHSHFSWNFKFIDCQFFVQNYLVVLNAINSHFFCPNNLPNYLSNLLMHTKFCLWKPKRSRDQLVLTTYFDPVVLYLKVKIDSFLTFMLNNLLVPTIPCTETQILQFFCPCKGHSTYINVRKLFMGGNYMRKYGI